MKGIGLAPSPNWYCSRVSDCSLKGIFAFGIKQNISLLNVSVDPPVFCGSLDCRSSTNDRIVALKFANTQTELVSAAENGTVTLWDVNNQVELKQFHEHQAKLTCVDWSPVEYKLIASGDEKGNVCIYNMKTVQKCQIHKNGQISVLTFSPYEKHVLAVGFRDGLILIVDALNHCSTFRLLRRHDDEIHSLCWIMTTTDSNNEISLMSGSKDTAIHRWNVAEGKLVATAKIPQYSSGYRTRHHDDHFKSRLWVTLYWSEQWSNVVFCSGYHGELLALDLTKEGKQQWEVVCSKECSTHNRSIFNISGYKNMACTISMDRQIILWNLSTRTSVNSITTLGGFVYGLHFSTFDIGYLAIGVGDNVIRVWNTQNSAGYYNVTSFWQGIRSKVTAVAWHPKLEGRLAFGTEEGRVGIYHVFSNKSPNVSNSNHRGTVYTVTWGVPDNFDGDSKPSKLSLFSCGNGQILVHPHMFQSESQDINTIIEKHNPNLKKFPPRTEISWNDDFTFMAIGNDDGSIEVYKMPMLEQRVVIMEIRKLIQCLRWHPSYTAEATESQYRFWLAAASNETTISIYDLESYLRPESQLQEEAILMKSSRKLEGHRLRVVSLTWSPHTCRHLASVSYDGTAQVWDTIEGKPLANFRGHSGRLFTIEWSPLNPDIIYSGGEDSTVQRWLISEQEHKTPPSHVGQKPKKGKKKNTTEDLKSTTNPEIYVEIEQLLQKKKEELLMQETKAKEIAVTEEKQSVSADNVPNGDCKTDVNNSDANKDIFITKITTSSSTGFTPTIPVSGSSGKKKKKKPFKSLLPVSAQLDNRGKNASLNDLMMLADRSKTTSESPKSSLANGTSPSEHHKEDTESHSARDMQFGSGDASNLGWFGKRIDAFRMMKSEASYHKEHDNLEYALHLEVWKGNIGNAINMAAAHNQLNDWLVSIAPLGSAALWTKACRLYSQQLVQEGQIYRAVAYLLAVCDVYGAVELLRKKKLFREALSLAKVRLSPDDSKIEEVLTEWASQSTKEGNYELAAKCCVAKGQFVEAGKVLSLRSDPTSLKVAAHLASASGDHADATRFAEQSAMDFLLKNNWVAVKEVVDVYPALRVFRNVAELNRLLNSELKTLDSETALWDTRFVADVSSLLIWKSYLVEGKPFLRAILDLWTQQDLIPSDHWNEVAAMKRYLEERIQGSGTLLSSNQLTLRISLFLTSALLSSVCTDVLEGSQKIAEALEMCHKGGHKETLQSICRLLLPNGISNVTCGSLFQAEALSGEVEQSSEDELIAQSFRAYYSLAILYHLLGDSDQRVSKESSVRVSGDLEFIDEFSEGGGNEEQDRVITLSGKSTARLAEPIIVRQLILNLLIVARAKIAVLETELTHVQKAIVNLSAKMRSQGISNVETKTNEKLKMNESSPQPVTVNVEELSLPSVAGLLSKSASTASNITEKTLDYVETLEISEEEGGILSASPSDNDLQLELDYSLPSDERYCAPDVELSTLRAEKERIEQTLRTHHPLEVRYFPDPLQSAMLLAEFCKRYSLSTLQSQVVMWAKPYVSTKEQRAQLASHQ